MHGRPQPWLETAVLYVGKAANLRQRLASYRSAATSGPSRKTRRLLARVEDITWEVCGSEREALLLENELIQRLRPKFNRAQAWPQGYWFVGCELGDQTLELRVTHESQAGGRWFGAFKSRQGFAALARCLWTAQHPGADYPPARWFDWDGPRMLRLAPSGAVGEGGRHLLAYLAGESDHLVDALEGRLLVADGLSPFDRSWRELDVETLRGFFRRGPCRNRVWARQLECADGLIPKERLDALILSEPKAGPQ